MKIKPESHSAFKRSMIQAILHILMKSVAFLSKVGIKVKCIQAAAADFEISGAWLGHQSAITSGCLASHVLSTTRGSEKQHFYRPKLSDGGKIGDPCVPGNEQSHNMEWIINHSTLT